VVKLMVVCWVCLENIPGTLKDDDYKYYVLCFIESIADGVELDVFLLGSTWIPNVLSTQNRQQPVRCPLLYF
jgi:hypothetical protein